MGFQPALNNLYDKCPEIGARLSALLKKYQDQGRSAPHLSW